MAHGYRVTPFKKKSAQSKEPISSKYVYPIFRLILEGLVICMLFGLIGCSRKNKSAEEIANTYLQKAYKKDFVVEELTKKDAGPFKTKEYSGFAYEKENPRNRFKVWVDKDSEDVTDAYYSVLLLPKATEWIQSEADGIWNEAKVGLVFDVIRPNSNVIYKEDEYLEFLEDESVDCVIYLFVDSMDELTLEKYEKFDEAISKIQNGYVRIYVVSSDELSFIDTSEYYDQKPNITISLRASHSSMKEKFQ